MCIRDRPIERASVVRPQRQKDDRRKEENECQRCTDKRAFAPVHAIVRSVLSHVGSFVFRYMAPSPVEDIGPLLSLATLRPRKYRKSRSRVRVAADKSTQSIKKAFPNGSGPVFVPNINVSYPRRKIFGKPMFYMMAMLIIPSAKAS